MFGLCGLKLILNQDSRRIILKIRFIYIKTLYRPVDVLVLGSWFLALKTFPLN